MFKKLINIILYFFLFNILDLSIVFLSYFVPKDKNLFLFTSLTGKVYEGNSKYVFEYIRDNHPSYKIFWVFNTKETYNLYLKEGISCIYKKTFRYFFILLRAKYIFVTSNDPSAIFFKGPLSVFGRFSLIQLWHGSGFKKICLNSRLYKDKNKILLFFIKLFFKKYKLIISISDRNKTIMKSSFNSKQVRITGFPRNDIFFDSSFSDKQYKQELKLEKYNKVILYAPTFRDKGFIEPFTASFWDDFNKFLIKTNQVFLIKKHPGDLKLNVPSNYKNIKDVTYKIIDLQLLLKIADLLITDYSSISSDYMLTDKPIIFYIYDYNNYSKMSRSFESNIKKVLPGPFIETEKELLKYLKNNEWYKDKIYKKKYKQCKDDSHKYQDGNSSKRVADFILSKLNM